MCGLSSKEATIGCWLGWKEGMWGKHTTTTFPFAAQIFLFLLLLSRAGTGIFQSDQTPAHLPGYLSHRPVESRLLACCPASFPSLILLRGISLSSPAKIPEKGPKRASKDHQALLGVLDTYRRVPILGDVLGWVTGPSHGQ